MLLEYFKIVNKFHYLFGICLLITMIYSNYLILTLPIQFRFPKVSKIVFNHNDTFLALNETSKINIDEYCKFIKEENNLSISSNDKSLYYKLAIDDASSIENWTYKLGLYCENEYKKNYVTSLIFFCSIFSNLVMSILADRYGRKFCFLFESLGTFIAFIGLFVFGYSHFSLLLTSIMILQTFTHLFTLAYLYLYEFFKTNYYNWIFLLQNIIASMFGILIYYYAEYFKNLFYVELATLLVTFATLIFSYFYIMESPDWIISKLKNSEEHIIGLIEANEQAKGEKAMANTEKLNHLLNEYYDLKNDLKEVFITLMKWESKTLQIEKIE